MKRRDFLKVASFAPTFPALLAQSAAALDSRNDNVLVVVRLIGGNDGLNAVVPFRDDLYYKGRPTIAIPRGKVLPLPGADVGLNPDLADFRWLIDQGWAGVVQNVGYADSSRSHSRATEIWETGTTNDRAPQEGWLGRYLDTLSGRDSVVGMEFGDSLDRTMVSKSGRSQLISHPAILEHLQTPSHPVKPASSALDHVRAAHDAVVQTSLELQQASKSSGARFSYPDTTFGEALKWSGNLIEAHRPPRLFYATPGSFESGFSFDTHIGQLAAHKALYSEFGAGLRAFAQHMKETGNLNRVQLLTFSDFGRQAFENRDGGTDHGDASVLFALGGKMRPGLHGQPPDIAKAHDGGIPAKIDFRQIYSNVLQAWLGADPEAILGTNVQPYSLIA